MEKIHVRIAGAEDAAVICLLARTTFTEAFGYLFRDKEDISRYFAEEYTISTIRKSIEDENNFFILAYYNELPVGYAKFIRRSPSSFLATVKTAQLQKIYVLNDFVSKKIGQELMNAGLEQLKRSEADVVWLSVFTGNPRAQKFYERNGFSTAGRHTYSIGKESFEFFVVTKELHADG